MMAARQRIAASANWILEGAELCLFVNDARIDDNPHGYEEAKGYAPKRFSNIGWLWNFTQNPVIGIYEPQHIKLGADQTIHGYFIRGVDGGIIHAEKFATPFEGLAGDSVTISPRILIKVKE